MSGLDRAFIRAYTKHQPGRAMGAAHAPVASGGRKPPVDYATQASHALLAPAQQGSGPAAQPWSAPRSPEKPVAPSYVIIDEPHAAMAGPHWQKASRPTSPIHGEAEPGGVRLSPLMATLSADWAGPAFEVDQFGWASPITDLVASGGVELDALAHKILSSARGGGQVVAIGSAEAGAGGTTLLLCLAHRLAAMQLKAALVDADFVDPTLAERLGMSPAFGWEDIMEQERSLCDVLIGSAEDGLALLPLRGPVAMPERLGGDLYWRTTIDALRGRYRLVLLDVGALGPEEIVELPWLRANSGIDSAIVVGRDGDEGREPLMSAVHRLHGCSIDVLGVVENFCTPEAQRLARHRPRVAVGA
ncbi:MAG: hypothetical protein K8T91_16125 [Planctomycetes bacterium]|nr:hypothetical protein [Planctomycetota bacterium]